MSWFSRLRRAGGQAEYAATLTLEGSVEPFQTGAPQRVPLKIRNEGAKRWSPDGDHPCRVSYHWLNPDLSPMVVDGHRTRLPRALAPGQDCSVELLVVPPNTTGPAVLEIDMVREHVCWFADRGSKTLRIPTEVTRGVMDGFADYETQWAAADLSEDYWSIVGPATRDEYDANGRSKFQIVVEHGLKPGSAILDVGCGTGCLTQTLVDYLDDDGYYVGTELVEKAVAFCRERFPQPNFHFLVNGLTSVPVTGDRKFDLIVLFSVFTHVFPAEIADLLRSLATRLADGGAVVADVFVVDEDLPGGSRGNRSKVDTSRTTLLDAFRAAGLEAESSQVVAREGEVQRTLFRLVRAGAR